MSIAKTNINWFDTFFTSELNDPLDDSIMMFFLLDFGMDRLVMWNIDNKVHGKFLFTKDPLQVDVRDVMFDFDYSNYLFAFEIECNYPGAVVEGSVFFQNITAYSSSGTHFQNLV